MTIPGGKRNAHWPNGTVQAAKLGRRWWFPLACTSLAIFVAAQSFSLGYWIDYGPGPGLFPLIIAVVILGTAWMLAVFDHAPAHEDGADGGTPEPANLSGLVKTILVTLASYLLVDFVDMVAGVAVLSFGLLVIVEREPWYQAALYAAVLSLGVWAVFVHFFSFGGG